MHPQPSLLSPSPPLHRLDRETRLVDLRCVDAVASVRNRGISGSLHRAPLLASIAWKHGAVNWAGREGWIGGEIR
jgi:hypothetical protein